MRIVKDLYLVGSGNFGISHPTDCNIYLVEMGGAFVLVDSGSGMEPMKILGNIDREGIPRNKIQYLVLTHAHWDHAGGCWALADALHCKICAHKLSGPLLNQEAPHGTSEKLQRAGERREIDIEIEDGQELHVGGKILKFIHSPGHSPDGVCIECDLGCGSALLCGDTVLANGKIGVITKNTNLQEYAGTMEKLLGQRPDSLFPGHGIFTLSNAHVHLALTREKMNSNWYEVMAGPTPFNPSWWRGYLEKVNKKF